MREHLILFYQKIAAGKSRSEKVRLAALEWAKLAPGEFMLAFKLMEKMSQQPEVAFA